MFGGSRSRLLGIPEVVPASWLKLDQDETVEYKGTPYIDATPTVVMKCWLVIPWGVLLAYLSGGMKEARFARPLILDLPP